MSKEVERNWLNKNEIFCVMCGKSAKAKTSKHRNPYMDSHFAFHIECIQDRTVLDKSPVDILRMMNVPYVSEHWHYCLEAEQGDYRKAVSKYLQMMGPRTQYPDFMASEFDETRTKEFEVTEEMIKKWGPDLMSDEYPELESSYKELVDMQEPRTQLEKSNYIDNAFLKKRSRQALATGSATDIKHMQAAYQASLKELGLDTAAINEKTSKLSLGERTKEWETEKPVPTISPEFEDVDNIMKYFKAFFVTPVLQNLGKATESAVNALGNFSRGDIPGAQQYEGDDDEEE